jgi:predicted transglutaminase-like cysteine proteinase
MSKACGGLLQVLSQVLPALVLGALATLAVAGGARAQTVASLPASTPPVTAVGAATPIPGWTQYCLRHPADCAVNPSEAATIPLNARTWARIVTVNRQVNEAIRPLSDQEHWGVGDRWDLPTDGAGDCEDYQLLKRKLLVEAGFPARALRITVVIDDEGEGHAVLMVRTDRGDFILDNKRNAVLPWHQTGYVYVKREGQDSASWVSLGRSTSPTVTANRSR